MSSNVDQCLSSVVKLEPQSMDTTSSLEADGKARESVVDSSPCSKRKMKRPRKVRLLKGGVASDDVSVLGGEDTEMTEQDTGNASGDNADQTVVGKTGTGRSVSHKNAPRKRAADTKKTKKQAGKKTAKSKRYKEKSQDPNVKEDKYAGKNPCSVCGRGFRYPSDLQRHSLTHTDQPRFQCEICDLKFRYRSNKITHMNNKHETALMYRCDKCGIGFLTEMEQGYHRLTYSKCKDRGNFRCRYCYQRFTQSDKLEEHELCHAGQKPFPCGICGQRFASRNALKTHEYTHPELGPKPHCCDLCNQGFDRKDRLKRHVAMVHEKISEFVCEHCNKFFRSADSLKSHRMTHTNEFRYLCSVCGYGCNWISCFKSHMVTHTGEKKHVCPECSRSFMSSNALKMHMIDHTGDAPHPCPKCPAKFKRLFHLKSHMITHSDARPFKCNHCDKGFKRRDNLEAHILTHSNLKPFHCKLCEKRFNNQSNLSMHMSRIHNAKKDFKYERTSKSISKRLGIGELVKSIEADVTVRQRLAEKSGQSSQNDDDVFKLLTVSVKDEDKPTNHAQASNTEELDTSISAASSNVLVE